MKRTYISPAILVLESDLSENILDISVGVSGYGTGDHPQQNLDIPSGRPISSGEADAKGFESDLSGGDGW